VTRTGKFVEVGVWDTEINYVGKRSLVVFVVDVSESKKLRSQLLQAQKMEAVGALAGGIAHDFNNLLTVVLGYSELIISEKDEKDPDYEDLSKIIYSARTATDLVRRILAFSRKTEARLGPVDLNNQVELLQKMLSRIISKNIKIDLNLDPDLPTIYVDGSQIDQVLMNLSLNARDAMAEGGTLTIETGTVLLNESYCQSHIEAQQGLHVLLTVRDTGVGIDEDSLERIFEPFFSTKKPGEGTGLGLAMVYGIVKRHGGHIICDSKPGFGSLFSIYLPVVHQVVSDAETQESEEFSALVSGTILWVDDEELVRLLGKRILEKEGYTVITAENGLDAIDIFREQKDEISVVVLDLIMPVMDGKKCLHEILQIDGKAKVLIGTGFSPDAVTKETLEAGATGFVQKPYDFKKLLQVLQDVLGQK
jgi:nitrogen-specific signal transduction histidine kinase/CheY-like chemotaxis protein